MLWALALGLVGLLGAGQWMLARSARGLEGRPVPADLQGSEFDRNGLLWFHSPACAPCRTMAPHVERWVGNGLVRPVDVFESPEVARAFGVLSTPTTVAVRDGQVVGVDVGVLRAEALSRRVQRVSGLDAATGELGSS